MDVDDAVIALVTASLDDGADTAQVASEITAELLEADPKRSTALIVGLADFAAYILDVKAVDLSDEPAEDWWEDDEQRNRRRTLLISRAAESFRRR